ncbi:MAG TPA: hypothetical protein EYH35_05265 [Thiotrichaceae bacterium]|nr:hypothetical protein [Thiotrichaceae bacterium]
MATNLTEKEAQQICSQLCTSCCVDNQSIVEPIKKVDNQSIVEPIKKVKMTIKKKAKKSTRKRKKIRTKKKTTIQSSKKSKQNVKEWLEADIYGSTISFTLLSPATLTSDNNNYRLTIKNQFLFDCKLQFNNAGQPSILSRCKSNDKDNKWLIRESKIRLSCTTTATSDTCSGRYTLLPAGDKARAETHNITLAKAH